MKKQQKQLIRLYKKHRKILLRYCIPIVIGCVLFGSGMFVQNVRLQDQQPKNIVWAVDETVKVPKGLRQALLELDTCKNYRGADSPSGVGLWGVTQVEQDKFAKITYGCSWQLTSYIVAVNNGKTWQLLQPTEYFADTAQGVPSCAVVTKYKIPPALEAFCVNEKFELSKNTTPM